MPHKRTAVGAGASGASGASAETPTRATCALLACGIVAGPLFTVAASIQAFTRAGFDYRLPAQPAEPRGLRWIQIINFVVAGLLFVAGVIEMRRVLHLGRCGTWEPRLIGAFEVSLIASGVVVTDPAFGIPPRPPPVSPDSMSWHGILHPVASAMGVPSLVAARFALARRFAGLRQPGWSAYWATSGVVVLALSAWPNLGGDSAGRFGPLRIALVLGFGWASVMSARLLTEPPRVTRSITMEEAMG